MTKPTTPPGDLRKQLAQAIHNAYGHHSLDRAYRATHQVLTILQPHLDHIAALEAALQRARTVADDMRHTTGARTWANSLDEALNGPHTNTTKD